MLINRKENINRRTSAISRVLLIALLSMSILLLNSCGGCGEPEKNPAGNSKFYTLSEYKKLKNPNKLIIEYLENRGKSNALVCELGLGESEKISIPATYDGKPVIAVNGHQSEVIELKESLPDGIEFFSGCCFNTENNKLTFPKSVKKLNKCFDYGKTMKNLKIKSVTFSGDIDEISYSFNNIPTLTEVSFKGTVGRVLSSFEGYGDDLKVSFVDENPFDREERLNTLLREKTAEHTSDKDDSMPDNPKYAIYDKYFDSYCFPSSIGCYSENGAYLPEEVNLIITVEGEEYQNGTWVDPNTNEYVEDARLINISYTVTRVDNGNTVRSDSEEIQLEADQNNISRDILKFYPVKSKINKIIG